MTAPSSAPWVPQGPPAATLRFRLWVKGVAVCPMGVILAGLVIAVVDAVRAGDAGEPFRGSDVGGAGVVIGWLIVAVIGGLLLLAIPLLLLFRVRVWPGGFVARAYVREYAVGLAQFTQIEVRSARRRNPYSPLTPTPVLAVRARDLDGRRRGFLLTRLYQTVDPALPTVDAWIRARPELAAGLARDVFVGRGVLAAEGGAPAAPPA